MIFKIIGLLFITFLLTSYFTDGQSFLMVFGTYGLYKLYRLGKISFNFLKPVFTKTVNFINAKKAK